MAEALESKWCKRCGEPLRDQRCSNCATAESRRRIGRAIMDQTRERRLAQYRDWAARRPAAAGWKHRADSILDALLPAEAEESYEIRIECGQTSRISLIRSPGRALDMQIPPLIALHCIGHLELLRGMASRRSIVERRTRDGDRAFAIELSSANELLIRRID